MGLALAAKAAKVTTNAERRLRYGYIRLSHSVVSITKEPSAKDDPMILTRQASLIIISALFTISLFSPHLPDSAEQWLSSLLLGSLVAVSLMLVSGCRHFLQE